MDSQQQQPQPQQSSTHLLSPSSHSNPNDRRITLLEDQSRETLLAIQHLTSLFQQQQLSPQQQQHSSRSKLSEGENKQQQQHVRYHSNVGVQRDHTPFISPPSPPHTSFSSSSSNSKLYNGLVKFNPPPYFLGKSDSDQMLLLNFISSMDRYLDAVTIAPDTY